MLTEVLDRVLKPEHREAGLYLSEDEDFLYLMRGVAVLAAFSSIGATITAILEAADKCSEKVVHGA